MRFRRLHAHVFGPLRDRVFELPPETALVFGPNESGKSSFRLALETILYGFDPAERESHPLVCWEGGAAGDLRIEAELERDTGPPFRVERELLARGRLRIAERSAPFEGPRQGNLALSCTNEMPREVFRCVYSLELAELAALEDKARSHVDELLLPQLAALGLRPIGELRAELANAHRSLWRPDRKAKNVVALESSRRLEELRNDARTAAAQERDLRDARREQAALEARVVALREERDRLTRALDDAPLRRGLAELERRRRGLGAPIDLSALGVLPLVDPEALGGEIAQLEQESSEPVARLARAPEVLSEPECAIQGALVEIDAALAGLPAQRAERERFAELKERMASLEDAVRRELASVLARDPGDVEIEAARAVPCEALRAAQSTWAAACEQDARWSASRAPRAWLLASAAAIAVGLAALLLEPHLAELPRGVAVGALALALLCLLAALLLPRRATPAPELGGLLAALAPPAPLLASPSELSRLIERIDRVQSTSAELHACEHTAQALEQSLRAREAGWQALCRRLGLDDAGDGEARSARLAAARGQLIARVKRVEEDHAERQRAQERLTAIGPQLDRKRKHANLLAALLREAEPGAATLELAFAAVMGRISDAEFVRQRESELRREPRYAEFARDPRVLAEIEPADADWRPEVIAQREGERTRANEELERAVARLGEIRTQLAGDPGSRQARVADEIRGVEEELAAVLRERDRLALLESIVNRAEREFRDEHQPDVLRRASVYLGRVTGGRWRRIDREEGANGRLLVTGGSRGESVPAEPPVSRGTLDQIFLCLRLGLLDHLDEGRERLPLILDDALLRTDDARRHEVYGLLAEASRRRQILLLTCQEWIAAEAENAMKLRRITLAP